MNGTINQPDRRRKKPAKVRPVILLRPGALARLFEGTGLTKYEDFGRELQYSPGALCVADNGGSVGAGLVAAVRNRFPLVPYEATFAEGLATYAPVRRKAA